MLDRTVQPEVYEISGLKLTEIKTVTLENGVRLNVIAHECEDLCRIVMVWHGGKYDVENSFALSTMTSMLLDGTSSRSSDEITEIFDFYGSKIGIDCGTHFTTLSLKALNRTLPELLPLLTEILTDSTFPQMEFEGKVRKLFASESMKRETVQYQSSFLIKQLLFGENHPAVKSEMPLEALKTLTRIEVKALYDSIIRNSRPEIFVAGKITADVMRQFEKAFSKLPSGEPFPLRKVLMDKSLGGKMATKVMPEQVQCSVDMVIPAADAGTEEYKYLKIAVVALGGYFGSRLSRVIREDRGLTYGIHAVLKGTAEGGVISITSQCAGENVEAVVAEVKHQMELMKSEPLPETELAAVRRYYLSALSGTSEELFATEDYYAACYKNGLRYDNFDEMYRTVKSISSEKIMEMAQRYFTVGQMFVGVAGNCV
ncbi:MAG: M16 family metallopeptidase [Muribaculaceae bacterium]